MLTSSLSSSLTSSLTSSLASSQKETGSKLKDFQAAFAEHEALNSLKAEVIEWSAAFPFPG